MQPPAAPASASGRWQGSAGHRSGLTLSALWTVAGVALTLWVFRAWEHPVPAFNPNDGPIPANANISFWLGGFLMGTPLAALTAALALVGLQYVSRLRSVQIRAAWISAVTAAVAVEVAFIGIFVAPGAPFGMAPGRVNWGLPVLAVLFAAVGAAMMIIISAVHVRLRASARAGLRG